MKVFNASVLGGIIFFLGVLTGVGLNYKAMREAEAYASLQSDVALGLADDLNRCEGRLSIIDTSLQLCVEGKALRTGIETSRTVEPKVCWYYNGFDEAWFTNCKTQKRIRFMTQEEKCDYVRLKADQPCLTEA